MTGRPYDISIDIANVDIEQSTLLLKAAGNLIRPVELRIAGRETIRAAGVTARKSVKDSVRWIIVSDKYSIDDPRGCFRQLYLAGNSLLLDLLGPGAAVEGGPLDQVRRFFADARRQFGQAPRLRLKSSIDLPIEILPLLRGNPEFRAVNGAALLSAATQYFMGLQFATSRWAPTPEPESLTLAHDADGKITVAPFVHSDFRTIARVHDDLATKFYHVLPALPGRRVERDLTRGRFSDLLMDVRSSNGVVSVAAHGVVRKNAYKTGLLFWGRAETDTITIDDLNASISSFPGLTEKPTGPLVILNSCSIGERKFAAPSTVPDVFVKAGYRAVLAPWVPINIPIAAVLTRLIFERMSENRGTSVEMALFHARRDLIRRCNNPVGLLYVLYGAGEVAPAA